MISDWTSLKWQIWRAKVLENGTKAVIGAREGSRKWNKSCDWSNNGKECCSDVSSRFFGVSIA